MKWKIKILIGILCGLLGCLSHTGKARDNDARKQNGAFFCGTGPQRQREAITRSRYRDSLSRRLPGRLLAPTQLQPKLAAADSGNIAVLEDDGTLQTEYNLFNLGAKSISFSPVVGNSQGYQVVTGSKPVATGSGTTLTLTDDDSRVISLSPAFVFYDKSYSSVILNSDGNLTFDQPDVGSSSRDLGRFAWGPPRIAPLFCDLDPGRGTVYYRQEADGILFIWQDVPNFDTTLSNTFSVKLFHNGVIEFAYDQRVDATEAVVGISPGGSAAEVSAADFSMLQNTETFSGTIAEVFTTSPSLIETAVARKFFQTHPDEFDQLVVFLTFPYDMQGAFSYELNVNNDISGIGLDLVNDSADYGSSGRLKSFVLMGGLDQGIDGESRFPDDPFQQFMRTYNSLEVITHEVAHRWLAFPLLWNGSSNSTALLHSLDLSHWSYFFNAEASLMEGNQILDQGAGLGNQRFRTSEVTDRLSNLDLYLMGFRQPAEIPPMFYVKNPTGTRNNPNTLPNNSATTFGGTRFDFTIDDVIRANGQRWPSELQSQKVHRIAFVLVSNSAFPATSAQIAKLQKIHDAFVPYFHQLTMGQAWALTDLHTSPATTPIEINFPYFQGDMERYTGFAVANWGAAPADVSFRVFDNAGAEISSPAGIVNPRMITIPPFSQTALLGEQIHRLELSGPPRNGWIQAASSSRQITGFFMEGNIAETFLDGAVADNRTATWLCFTRAHGTTGTLTNLINLVNPNNSTAHLAIRLMNPNGQQQGPTLNLALNAHARIAQDLSALFPGIDPSFIGYLTVTSDLGVVGYESFEGSAAIFSLPAQPFSSATTLYSAQFASGPSGSIRYYTDINVINTSTERRHIQVSLIGNNGAKVGGIAPVEFSLEPGAQRLARGEEYFGLQSAAAAAQLTEGTLVFSIDGPGVIGDVSFGDPQAGSFMAALPLDGSPVSDMVLSQIAQGTQGAGTSYFTGIAMYNPNAGPISVTLDVYAEQGFHTGSGTIQLDPGKRLSKTLPELVPGFSEQMRGYIRLSTSGGPVISFGIFGEATSVRFLAAIPPQPVLR